MKSKHEPGTCKMWEQCVEHRDKKHYNMDGSELTDDYPHCKVDPDCVRHNLHNMVLTEHVYADQILPRLSV